MKIFFVVLLFLTGPVIGRNFYVSAAGSDANSGLSQGLPWMTSTKVNGFALVSGDSVFYRRGDVFGSIIPQSNGVYYGFYGTGAAPIIGSLTTVTGWTNVGTNLWQANVPGSLPTLNIVVQGSSILPIGRYPQLSAPNGGYLTYTKPTGRTDTIASVTVTCSTLPSSPNWTGSQWYGRRQSFEGVVATVTNHVDSVLTLRLDMRGNTFTTGFGFFFQNSPITLTYQGAYYFDSTGHTITMYSTSMPTGVQVATSKDLVSVPGGKSGLTFEGLHFQGANECGLNINNSPNLTVKNCVVDFCGETGIYHTHSPFVTIANNIIQDCNYAGIYGSDGSLSKNITISNNTITRIGMIAGAQATKTSNTYLIGVVGTGIVGTDSLLFIGNNTITQVGYCGISLLKSKPHQHVHQNVGGYYCRNKNDGGFIYNGGLRQSTGDTYTLVPDLVIDSNTVWAGGDASAGTPFPGNKHERGIYMDASSGGLSVFGNTIFNTFGGIYLSQAVYNNIYNNHISGIGLINAPFEGGIDVADGLGGIYPRTRHNVITNNVVMATSARQMGWYHQSKDSVAYIGTVDSNTYIFQRSDSIFNWNPGTGVSTTPYTFAGWKAAYGYETHSTQRTENAWQFFYNTSSVDTVIDLTGYSWSKLDGSTVTGSYTIPQHSSDYLLKGAALNTPPTARAGVDQLLGYGTTSTTLDGSASTAVSPATITGVRWTQTTGDAATIVNPTSFTPNITGLTTGIRTFHLVVTDSNGLTGSDDMTVTVNPDRTGCVNCLILHNTIFR